MLKKVWLVKIDGEARFVCENEDDALELSIAVGGTFITVPCISDTRVKGYDALDAQVLEGEYERV